MPSAQAIFELPDDHNDFAAILDAIDHNGGTCDGGHIGFEGADASYYRTATTNVASADFDDCDDPLEDIAPLLTVLKELGLAYLAVTDSFTERSRGTRVEGAVILNLNGTEQKQSHPWVKGDPTLDERSILNADYPQEAASEMSARFFPGIPVPRYA